MAPSFILAAKNAANDEASRNGLSDLPDSLIHHIFSFLEMNDFVRVAYCSNRMRMLCLSNPYIYLTANPHSLRYMGPTKVQKLVERYFFKLNKGSYGYSNSRDSAVKPFITYLDNYLSQRDDKVVIQSFHLEFNNVRKTCGGKGREILNVWLNRVAKCKVEELYINSDISPADPDPISLPQPLFSSNCLRVLELELPYCEFELPSAILVSLETLSMKCFRYSSELIGEWISIHCPSLKKLSLIDVKVFHFESRSMTDLTIISANISPRIVVSSANLQKLSIYLGDRRKEDEEVCLRVSAPNLEVLKWDGNPVGNINFGEFPSLKDVTLNRCHSDSYHYPSVACMNGIFNLVKSSSCAKVLRISLTITEVMFLKDQEALQLEDLEQLFLRYTPSQLEDYQTASIADFVKRMPNLSSLIIEKDKNKQRGRWDKEVERSIKKKAGKCNRQSRKLGEQLKEVKIEVFDHDECIRLVNYFIKSADGLEKMTIFFSLSFFHKLAALLDKGIKGSSRAINVITYLKEKKEEYD